MDVNIFDSSEGRENLEKPRGHILIIDDEVFIRNAFQLYFETIGFRVDVADGAETALKLFDESTLDVIILDLVMPGMNGLELLKEFKQRRADVEVIIATGCGSLSSAIDAMRKGAFDYITKPIVNFDDELLKVVEDALHYRRSRFRTGALLDPGGKKGFLGQSEFAYHNLALFEKFVGLADVSALWRAPGETGGGGDPVTASEEALRRLLEFMKSELGISSGILYEKAGEDHFTPAHAWGSMQPVAFRADLFSSRELFGAVQRGELLVFATEDLNVELLGFNPRKLHEIPMAIHLPLVLEGVHRGALFLFFSKRADELKNAEILDNGHPYLLLAPLLGSAFFGMVERLEKQPVAVVGEGDGPVSVA